MTAKVIGKGMSVIDINNQHDDIPSYLIIMLNDVHCFLSTLTQETEEVSHKGSAHTT